MKQLFRAIVLVVLVGGWAVASASVHIIRVSGKAMPVVITKNQLTWTDTYLDTRNWTLADDRAHPEFVTRLITLGQYDVLAHTVNTNGISVESQLRAAVGVPVVPANAVRTVLDIAKTK